jgi:hypothetical protein
VAAGGNAFVRCSPRIGCDHHDARRGNFQLLGGDLQQRRCDPLSEFGFAGEDRDAAVALDPDPGIEPGRLSQARGK